MKKRKLTKLNNRGAALVIAIIVVAFISILTTILLYLAVMNYQMKSTDYNTKVSFYGAETPLEELRTLIVIDVGVAAEKAYYDVLQEYGNYSTVERKDKYRELFFGEFEKIWKGRVYDETSTTWKWKDGMKDSFNLISTNSASYHIINDNEWSNTDKCGDDTCDKAYHIVLSDIADNARLVSDSEPVEVNGIATTKYFMDLKGIRVIYTENNFTSIIETTYNISVPPVDFSVEQCVDAWSTEDADKKRDERISILYEGCVVYKDWTKK